jgi:Flp pilus assembly protein TadG
MKRNDRKPSRRGATLVEFAFVLLTLLVLIFASIEFDRVILVYTSIADAAKAGVRYAIVHGSHNAASSGQITSVVQGYAAAGALQSTNVTVTVAYAPDNSIGSLVTVTVSYPYDPLVGLIPLGATLSSAAQGIIVY